MADNSIYTKLVRYESELGDNLEGKTGKVFLNHFEIWHSEVVRLAKSLGSISTEKADVDRALTLAEHPIFVCGLPRSGTTWFRDLIDGHSQICVLAGEARLFVDVIPRIEKETISDLKSFYSNMWLRDILSPCVSDPFLGIGKSTLSNSPYVDLVRYFYGWWDITSRVYPNKKLQPLIAWMLAQVCLLNGGKIPSNYKYWLEKTTSNELFIDQIRAELPKAQFYIMVRDPIKNYHSKKEREIRDQGEFRSRWATMRQLVHSHSSISEYYSDHPPKYINIVKYEQLVVNIEPQMKQICERLKIDFEENLLLQTTLGQQTFSNTSFSGQRPLSQISITEIKTISAFLSDHCSKLGYDLAPLTWYLKLYYKIKFYLETVPKKILQRIWRLMK